MSTLISLPARWIPLAHTVVASLAFGVALFMGWASGLWKDLCENAVSGWPEEWFPSVSATIGDHARPRAPFHILIALCATPRFLLLLVQWLLHRYHSPSAKSSPTKVDHTLDAAKQEVGDQSTRADVELGIGVARTFCCGGWVYITSRDHHDLHDLFMILYLLLTLPWMALSTMNATNSRVRSRRMLVMSGFLTTIPPLIWLYYRHSVLRIPGAYTYYAFLEWSLVVWDVGFDALAMLELTSLRLVVVDISQDGVARKFTANGNANGPTEGAFLRPMAPKAQRPETDWTADIRAPDGPRTLRIPRWDLLAWTSDVFHSVCFWTVFTSLGLQLFYWSIWKLALAGSELALLANLSAFTLSHDQSRRYVTSRNGMLTHRFLMILCGMGVYWSDSPALRLVGISLGTWVGWLSLYGNWVRLQGSEEMLVEGKILGTGLVITMFLKYLNASNNPFWAIMNESSGGWNKTGLAIAALSLLEYSYRPLDLYPAPPLPDQPEKKDIPAMSKPSRLQKILVTLGLGSLIHLVQTFVTDSGTLYAWTWTGFPITGPTLHPFSGLVIASASLGLLLPPALATHPVPSLVATAAAITLYVSPDWPGFLAGLLLVCHLTSLLPPLLRVASALPPAQTFGHALAFNIALDVASVVTAAYAFVPLGWLLRERTDLILGLCMACLVLGTWAARRVPVPGTTRLQLRSRRRMNSIKRWTRFALLGLSVGGIAAGYAQMPKELPAPYYPEHRIFSGGIWTVHFGLDMAGRDSQRRMRDLIRDMQVDVLGLLESDLQRFVYGNRDLTRVIAEELGYYVDLGPGPNKHTWGAALLSKFPILNSTHHLLPSPHGELAPAIHATLDIHGERVNVWVSHNGQEEDALDRELQTIEIARNLRETKEVPTVFLGYLVTHPGDLRPWPYQILMEDGDMWDIEIEDKWRWCEYIAFRGLWRIAFARVHESDISDTELQVGKFLLPKPGEKVVYESNQELYWHIGEKDVPEPWRMPSMFRGEGVRGHMYRVWDGPLYYLPPARSGLQRYGTGGSTSLDGA